MTREVVLTKGFVATVDDGDYDRVVAAGSWQINKCDGRLYAGHATSGGNVRLHTFLTGWPLVDHVNGDGLDNRRANLRPATPSQNAGNIGVPRDNTSGLKGVGRYRNGRFRAYLTADGRQLHLGYFDTAEQAGRAYDAAALARWGEFARPNFPREDVPA